MISMASAIYKNLQELELMKKYIRRYNFAGLWMPLKPFYAQYPYRGSLPIAWVDKRGLVDSDYKLFFNRVPKAGNSSIVANIYQLKHGSVGISASMKRQFRTPSSLNPADLKHFKDYFKFTFVRNPYARVLSAYLDKVVSKDLSRLPNCVKKNGTYIEFPEFCAYLEKSGLYDNIHWAPQTSILLLPVSEFHFIGKLENIENDMHYVMGKITGDSQSLQISDHRPHRTNANEKIMRYYDDYTADIIMRLYKDDFETFGYDPRPPHKKAFT